MTEVATQQDGWVDSKIKGIKNQYSLLADGISDVRPFEIVVKLGPDAHNKDPETGKAPQLVYVGNDGKGEIRRISDKDLELFNPKHINFVDLSTLSTAGAEAEQRKAAAVAAHAIIDNLRFADKDRIGFPFNPEKPEAAKGEDLARIRDMLQNIRVNMYSASAPDGAFDGSPTYVSAESKAGKKAVAADIPAVDAALARAERALDLQAYAKDLKGDTAGFVMDEKQKAGIVKVLDAPAISPIEQMLNLPPARLDKRYP